MAQNKKRRLERNARIHEILSNLSDEEFWTVQGSLRLFEFFGHGHYQKCEECGPREDACRKRWGFAPNTVPITTSFQREIRRMEHEIKEKGIFSDDPNRAFNLVDYAFRQHKK